MSSEIWPQPEGVSGSLPVRWSAEPSRPRPPARRGVNPARAYLTQPALKQSARADAARSTVFAATDGSAALSVIGYRRVSRRRAGATFLHGVPEQHGVYRDLEPEAGFFE